jgi:hypothetical protein
MTDRFDLEQEILQCWNVVDEIKFYLAKSDTWTEDEKLNYLIGLTVRYDKKFENMFDIFSECVHQKIV